MSCNKLTMHWEPYQKALNSSEQYPHQSPQRLWDWWEYMTQMPYTTSMAWPTAPGAGRRSRMRGQSSTTCGECTTGSAWCVTNVTTTHQPHQTPSATIAGRTANPQGREAPMSQPHPDNCQLISPNWESEQRSQGNLASLGAALSGTPHPLAQPLEENQMEKAPPTNLQCPVTCFPAHLDQAATH